MSGAFIVSRIGNIVVEVPLDYVIALKTERETKEPRAEPSLLNEAELIRQDAASYLDQPEEELQ